MTHLQQGDRRKHRASACRRGRHDYGEKQYVGAGITRQVCATCGDVTIDLTAAHEREPTGAKSSPPGTRPDQLD